MDFRMQRFVYLLVVMGVAFVSCDKVPMNGPLDGMWQLMTIETPDSTHEARSEELFLSFQLHLTQWEKKHTATTIYAHFERQGDSLRVYDFASAALHDLSQGDDDHLLTPAQMADGAMNLWGIHTVDARFHIDRLDSKDLILTSADTTLTFRKF